MFRCKPIVLLAAALLAMPVPAISAARPKHVMAKSQSQQSLASRQAALVSNLKAAKQKVQNGRALFQQQWQAKRQTAREVNRAQKRLEATFSRFEAAGKAYLANTNPQTQALMVSTANETKARLTDLRGALVKAQDADGKFKASRGQRDAAIADLVAAREAVKRGPAVAGRPAFSAAAPSVPQSTRPVRYGVLSQPSLASLLSSASGVIRSSAAGNGLLPPTVATVGTPGTSTSTSTGTGTSNDMSFRQSDRSIRSSAAFTTLNTD
ncbi:hypothetical protein [Novosphingobium sp.]|uniref:hypothetical protein n=1 Tax=Novosphingobium sp. TaxID=1874826 RepID=UPI00260D2417|nr:hypothetical protein [Novosphingobium sp.]